MKPKSSPRRFFSLSAIILAGVFAPHAAMALTYSWTPTVAGAYNWNNASGQNNWTSGFPNAIGDIANLNINLLGDQLINLNQTITVGTINLGDTTGATYNTTTIAGNGGSLILDVSTGSATIAKTTAGNNVTDLISANIQINDNLIVNNTSAGGITISGDITEGVATRSLTKQGAGTLTLSGNNSYTGLTSITGGTLQLGAADRISNSSALTINGSGATFNLGGFSETVGAVTLTQGTISNGTLTGSSYTLQNGTISAVLAGAGNLGKTVGSSNTVTLSGANTYTGTTTISAGTLALGIAENVGISGPLGVGGTISFEGPRTIGNFSGTLQYSASNTFDYSSRFVTATANQAYKVDTNGQNITWATPLNSTGGWLVKQGGGTLTLGSGNHTLDMVLMNVSNANTGTLALSNGTILNATTAVIIGGDGEASLGVNANIAALTTAASGNVTIRTARLGVGLQKSNTGTFTLGSGGTLTLEGTSGGRTLLQVGYSISSDGSSRTATGTMDLSTGAASLKLSQLVIGQQTSAGANGAIGTLTLSSNAANHLDISGADSVVIIGSQATNNSSLPTTGTLTIGNLDATSSITSTNNGTAILLGQKLGTSTQPVTGNLNLNGGTLMIATTGSAIAGGAGTANLNLSGGVTLKAGANSGNWIQNLDTAVIGSGGATIHTNGYNLGISQAFSGAGKLTKDGAGTLELLAGTTHTYSGDTEVKNGTLVVNGNISTSTLTTVKTGAMLQGTGTVGALTIDSGAFHNPGNSPGVQNTGDYIMNGTLTAEINGLTPGAEHDQVNVSGTVNLGGSLIASFLAGTYAANDLIFILLNDGNDAITGTFSGLAQGATVTNYGGFDWTISYLADSVGNTFTNGNDIALMAVTPVPEPRAALLGGIGMLLLLRRRRNA